jgi:hypothetical protein
VVDVVDVAAVVYQVVGLGIGPGREGGPPTTAVGYAGENSGGGEPKATGQRSETRKICGTSIGVTPATSGRLYRYTLQCTSSNT